MGNFFTRQPRSRNYYKGIDTMELLETHYNGNEKENNDKIWETIDETKSELSNTNNVIKYIEENTSENIKLLSTDIHHINEAVSSLKTELVGVKAELSEALQINRILAKKLNNNLIDIDSED